MGYLRLFRSCVVVTICVVFVWCHLREDVSEAEMRLALCRRQDLFDKGYREITLLGQNVDSYKWENPESGELVTFDKLLEMCALVSPLLRIRFSTSHPKDITDEVLYAMKKYDNICKIYSPASAKWE